jgi:hypothetical protein
MPPKGSKVKSKSNAKGKGDPQSSKQLERPEGYVSEGDTVETEDNLETMEEELQRLRAQKQKAIEENEERKRQAAAKRARLIEARKEIEAIQAELKELETQQPNTQEDPAENQMQQYLTFDPQSPLCEHLQYIPWPTSYKPIQLPKFNGSTDPRQFIMSYEAAIASAGGNDAVMAKSLVIACEGAALAWFTRLPPGCILTWDCLKTRLQDNFQKLGRPSITSEELFRCKQGEKESLAAYFQRFIQLKAQASDVPEETIIAACIGGLGPSPCPTHISMNRPCTWHQLYSIIGRYTLADEGHRRRVAQKNAMRKASNPSNNQYQTRPSFNQQSTSNLRQGYQVHTIDGANDTQEQRNHQQGSQPSHFDNAARGRGRNPRGRGRGRGRGTSDAQQRTFFCAFHGEGSDHGTSRCPETIKTKQRMEQEKSEPPPKTVNYTSWN